MRPDTVKSAALLREARLRAGLSQVGLAERSGKDRVQLGRWEAGQVAPSLDTLVEVVRACGFDLPLMLAPLQHVEDEGLTELQRLSSERRLDRMLDRLAGGAGAVTAEPEQSFDPRAILASLERNRADYVVIGGLARVLRGADEITTGVDICPSLTGASLDRLRAAVIGLDARGTDGTDYRVTRESLHHEAIIQLNTSYGQLNVVANPAGIPRGFADLRRAATIEPLGGGLRPAVATVGDLAAMAAALHRDQDVARLPELRRIMELEVDRQTIGLRNAARGPEVRSPTIGGPVQQDWLRRSGPKLTS